jgi:hypothetical protein
MNRKELKELARCRLREAIVLYKAECYDGAYYLAGYAVECGLKACIAKLTMRHDFPPKLKVVQNCYVHDLVGLVAAAKLQTQHQSELNSDPQFKVNWTVVKDWSEEKRYEKSNEVAARDLIQAIRARKHGVMQWIRRYW